MSKTILSVGSLKAICLANWRSKLTNRLLLMHCMAVLHQEVSICDNNHFSCSQVLKKYIKFPINVNIKHLVKLIRMRYGLGSREVVSGRVSLKCIRQRHKTYK